MLQALGCLSSAGVSSHSTRSQPNRIGDATLALRFDSEAALCFIVFARSDSNDCLSATASCLQASFCHAPP